MTAELGRLTYHLGFRPVDGAGLDAEVRDRMDWLKAALLALHGIVSDSALSKVKGALYGVHATRTATLSLSTATETAITLPTEDFDSDAFHSTSTNTERITIPTGGGGYYLVGATVSFGANGTGDRWLFLRQNGVALLDVEDTQAGNASIFTPCQLTSFLLLAAGDYIDLRGWQDSGG